MAVKKVTKKSQSKMKGSWALLLLVGVGGLLWYGWKTMSVSPEVFEVAEDRRVTPIKVWTFDVKTDFGNKGWAPLGFVKGQKPTLSDGKITWIPIPTDGYLKTVFSKSLQLAPVFEYILTVKAQPVPSDNGISTTQSERELKGDAQPVKQTFKMKVQFYSSQGLIGEEIIENDVAVDVNSQMGEYSFALKKISGAVTQIRIYPNFGGLSGVVIDEIGLYRVDPKRLEVSKEAVDPAELITLKGKVSKSNLEGMGGYILTTDSNKKYFLLDAETERLIARPSLVVGGKNIEKTRPTSVFDQYVGQSVEVTGEILSSSKKTGDAGILPSGIQRMRVLKIVTQ